MKTIKYFLSVILLFTTIISCVEEEFGDDGFVDTVVAPTNVTALFNVTQDNTGLVTITPNSEGAVNYTITYGDDTTDPITIGQGESVEHTYAEGNFDVVILATGITGLTTEVTVPLVVSFNAPENLVVEITNDEAVSKQVNVTATADFATMFDVYFGEEGNDEPVSGNIGDTVSYVYEEAGTYTITVVAKGAAIETTEYTVEFEAIAIVQPITSAPTPPYRYDSDVISIFSEAYDDIEGTDYNPDWGQSGQGSSYAMFDLDGDEMLNYINLSYQGISLGETVDVSGMEYLHMDVWTADLEQIKTSLINGVNGTSTEAEITSDLTADEWTSIEIPISEYTDLGLSVDQIFQLKFVGEPWAAGTVFIDNVYFYKEPTVVSEGIVGTWKMSPVAGALKVGPSANDGSWWSSTADDVTTRSCFFDDEYIFTEEGTFSNVLGSESWIEGWQGGSDACGTPVSPHDGSNAATFVYDESAGTVVLNGVGSYLGIPKAYNGGELSDPADAPSSITYDITLSNNDTAMTVVIEISGGFWTYELVKEGAETYSAIEGTWMIKPEAGALGVGPGQGDISWWSNTADDVTARDCLFDDTYVFNADGSYNNVLGVDSWIEGWQGGSDACGTPVSPHDGSTVATYSYDSSAGTVTLNGTGAFLGLPKAYNMGELAASADAPESITYVVTFSDDDNEMTVDIQISDEGWWRYELVREGTYSSGTSGSTGSGSTGDYDLTLPIDFESDGFGANWSWNVFENDSNPALEFVGNPDASGINTSSTVAKITALQTGAAWVGTETVHGEMGITWDISSSNSIIKIMVYKTVISDVGIKLTTASGGSQGEIKIANTKINEWEELTFDFSSLIGSELDGATSLDQIVVFPDFDLDGRTQDNVVYFDNITFQ